MADLIKDFFERDLSDAEEQQLAEILAAFPDHSLRFAELARQVYRQTGLPEGDNSHGFGGGSFWVTLGLFFPLILRSVLILGMTGFSAYLLLRVFQAYQNPPPPLPSIPAVVDQQKIPSRKPRSHVEAHPVLSAAKPESANPVSVKPLQAVTHPEMVKPVPYKPGQSYEGLDVIVEQKAAGLLTVRTLNSSSQEVRLLFAGMLAPGKWDFLWDGKLENGKMADRK